MVWAVLVLLVFDLGSVRQEPNLEKRSDLALKNASTALDAARDAYQAGNLEQAKTSLAEFGESVDLSHASLEATGKNPRGAGSYKRAEIATRQLLRRLDGLRQIMSAIDREVLDPAQEKVSAVHDKLIQEIMGKKPKK